MKTRKWLLIYTSLLLLVLMNCQVFKANRKPQSAGFRGYCPNCLVKSIGKDVKQLQKIIQKSNLKLVDHQPVQTPPIDRSSNSSHTWSCSFACEWFKNGSRDGYIITKHGSSTKEVVLAAQNKCRTDTDYKGVLIDNLVWGSYERFIPLQISIRSSCSKNSTSSQPQRFSCIAYSAEVVPVHVANHYHDGWLWNNYTVPVIRNKIFKNLEVSSGPTMKEAFSQLMSNKQYRTLIVSSSVHYTEIVPVKSPEEVCVQN